MINDDMLASMMKKINDAFDKIKEQNLYTSNIGDIKVAGNELESVRALQSEDLEEVLYNVSFPKNVLNYIENNKWIPILNKHLYFNKEIMACYPDFTNDEYPDLYYNPVSSSVPTIKEALDVLQKHDIYTKYGIDWDIQTLQESKNSFFNVKHPMESSNRTHRIRGYGGFITKTEKNNMLSHYNDPDEDVFALDGMLIPIFRLGRKEDHDAFNTNKVPFNYSPETILLLFVVNDLIPDFKNDEINSEYEAFYDEISELLEVYEDFAEGIKISENKKVVLSDFKLDEVGEEIVLGIVSSIYCRHLFYHSKVKFTMKNGDSLELPFFNGKIDGEGLYIYENGDEELCNCKRSKDFIKIGESTIMKLNGDVEKLTYIDGVPQGKSEYIFANGVKEIRSYSNGVLEGDAVLYSADDKELKIYRYENNEKRDITAMKKILDIDKLRVNLNSYDENILTDPNRGHWDLFEIEDISEIEREAGKKIYRRDPKKDIKNGGLVGIDFGTKSTVVVFQDDNNRTLPMRISGVNLNAGVQDSDYENPTVIEFRDIDTFMKKYNEKKGRPLTDWKDVTVSHTAFQNLINGTSDEYYSIISELKQWAGVKNEKIVIRDKKGLEILFPPYMDLEEGDEDPIELYAYYIGSYINNMTNGIYMEYILSFPVTYEKAIREKILESFKRGIRKSFPVSLIEDDEVMKRFKVIHGANEPAAYAACALQEYGFEPDEEETVYYGVFDFGGGTADFDFGIWKASEDERNFDYELIHFGAGGDRYLGGENILKELAYEVFRENQDTLRKEKISFARPQWCERFIGDEGVIDNSPEAKLNIKMLMEKLRPFWEEAASESESQNIIKVSLYAKDGVLKNGVELSIAKEKIETIIEAKIESGIENFFMAMKKAMKNESVDKVNILLAGNSCKHPKVVELFEKHRGNFDGEIEIFPALGTKEAYAKMKERGIEIDPEDRTRPTGKTGVAYGIIDSRIGGRIDVKNLDEENNINNEINFRYYIGYEGRKKLKVILSPQTQYEKYIYYLDAKPMFDIYYTTLPEAMDSKMSITKAKRKRINLKDDYRGAKIYIKSVSPDTIKYAVSEKDIDEKEYLEEGVIELD